MAGAENQQPVEPAGIPVGTIVGAYQIQRRLGAGSVGVVYQARDAETGGAVALKVLHEELAAESKLRTRFMQEARRASRLRHPHVVDVRDVVSKGGHLFAVMSCARARAWPRCWRARRRWRWSARPMCCCRCWRR
jgi:serine/threonine protein kinase